MDIGSEGRILVSSTTEQRSTGGGRKDAKSSLPRGNRDAGAKDEGHVSQALRTVYQHAVDEDIPAEMLDLLSKLD
ncbi:hypothetical protein MOK15_07240 [Sphingobium sp. BYY-5]|uniref:NepR family anti-sigma factor n=1 Tax=Sphingobium sp. BYY-5 TaxID=2926400 RepID=UPI001FA739EF|nr:NepR family anti-sigma factor [Sphingobium sp. BYY-5]MCI4589884.1 hypothetical protein [Sphingobium sp. BYY-5]